MKTPKAEARSARVAYGAVLTGSALLALFAGGRMVYALFYLCLLLLPLSLAHAFAVSRFLGLTQHVKQMALDKGQLTSWTFILRNACFLPAPWIEVLPRACAGLEARIEPTRMALLPGGREKRTIPVQFRYRGAYRLGMEKIVVRDAMRLFAVSVPLPESVPVLVYPRVYELRRFAMSRLTEEDRPCPIAQPSDEVLAETRKYIPGDTLSRIHWNLTARNQELMTRLFVQEAEQRVMCVVDLRPFEAEDTRLCEDAVIEAALAAARFTLWKGVPLLFTGYDRGTRYAAEARDLSRFEELRRVCAALSFGASLPPELLLNDLRESRYVMLFTAHDPSDELLKRVPADGYMDVFRIRRGGQDAVPPYGTAGRVRVFALDADERLPAVMENVE
ncbi:MAG: DUF58 domain-containing protein [Oscillospiraceae bacterium]|nr:DUF58 domain-containing protein [Oscillospiraceae bacterium]